MTTKSSKRDDDSIDAATIATDAHTRINEITDALTNPDRLGELINNAFQNSSKFRKEHTKVMMEFLDDYDNRKELERIIYKVYRSVFYRWFKYIAVFIVGAATVLGTILAYVALTK